MSPLIACCRVSGPLSLWACHGLFTAESCWIRNRLEISGLISSSLWCILFLMRNTNLSQFMQGRNRCVNQERTVKRIRTSGKNLTLNVILKKYISVPPTLHLMYITVYLGPNVLNVCIYSTSCAMLKRQGVKRIEAFRRAKITHPFYRLNEHAIWAISV